MKQTKQFYVSIPNKRERAAAISWLEERGYRNIGGLTGENYSFPVLVIEKDRFFGTNATCMACLANVGKRAMTFESFKRETQERLVRRE